MLTTRHPRAPADRGNVGHLPAGGYGLEEPRDLVVEEREAGRPESHVGRRQLEPAAGDPSRQLREAVAAFAEPREHGIEISEPVHVGGGVGTEPLPEDQLAGLAPEVAPANRREVAAVRAGIQPFDRVDDQEWIDDARAERIPGDGRAGRGARGVELLARDRPERELARGPRAAANASRFARITPPSQYTWRYARERYFHALRQNVLVSTATIGAPATGAKPPVAEASAPRTSPARRRRRAPSCAE